MENKSDLFKLIMKYKEGDEKNITELYLKFDPLLKKYSSHLHSEDAYNELVITFIKCIHNIPLDKENFRMDKYILSYIKSSIQNRFNQLCSLNPKYIGVKFFSIDDTSLSEKPYDIPVTNNTEIDECLLFYDLQQLLTANEFQIIKMKYMGYTDGFIAETMHVTRQAVNKRIHKLQGKLKSYFSKKGGT